MADLSEEELQALYCWIDEIPLTRQKKNIARDFSDGVLTAEIVHHYFPQLVALHNYSPANSTTQKIENWRALNRKVFSKLNFSLPDDIIQSAACSKSGVMEFILTNLRTKIEHYLQNIARKKELSCDSPYTAYDPTELSTASDNPHMDYGQFDQLRHTGAAGVTQDVFAPVGETGYRQPQPVGETRFNPPQQEYMHQHPQPSGVVKLPHAYGHNLSKPHPPTHDHRHHHHTHPSSHHHSSTLPPIHPHNNSISGGVVGVPQWQGSVPKQPQPLSKLPTIVAGHGRSKTYAGRANRVGPGSTAASGVGEGGSGIKRSSSTQQQIRMAQKEQKLYETQEYIQLLQMKVTRLEHLMQIKDMKINELQRQLALTSRHPLHKR